MEQQMTDLNCRSRAVPAQRIQQQSDPEDGRHSVAEECRVSRSQRLADTLEQSRTKRDNSRAKGTK